MNVWENNCRSFEGWCLLMGGEVLVFWIVLYNRFDEEKGEIILLW